MVNLKINGTARQVDSEDSTPLLWVLRDELSLTGTKFGCGAGLCGACTVHVDGEAMRSCQLQIGDLDGAEITTIEFVAQTEATARIGSALQAAWIAEQVPQCGYCQSGMIMAATALLAETPAPTDQQINEAMTNICRCGTYSRVRTAIHRAAAEL